MTKSIKQQMRDSRNDPVHLRAEIAFLKIEAAMWRQEAEVNAYRCVSEQAANKYSESKEFKQYAKQQRKNDKII